MQQLPRRGTRPRRLIPLALAAAGVLATAPAALADTTVSIENGQFGSGQVGKHLFVKDTASFPFDERMQVNVVREGTKLVVSDDFGNVHINGTGCQLVGGNARCDATGIVGIRYEAGNKNDDLRNSTDLVGVFLANKGNDTIHGGSVRDEILGQEGDDEAFGGDGPDVFAFEPGKDTFDGQDGTDTINYAAAPAEVSIQLDDSSANDGVAGQEDLLLDIENGRGSPFDDTIDGSAEPNVLNGLAGKDSIRGRSDDDRLIGGAGPDVLNGEGGLNDIADYSAQVTGVSVTLDDSDNDGNAQDGPAGDRDNVTSSTEHVRGGAGNDNLNGQVGSPVANELTGNDGLDTLRGREGADSLDGGAGDDTLEGGAGPDDLSGGIDEDSLNGGTEADVLDGGGQIDLVAYIPRTEDVTVTLDGVTPNDDGGASDGPPGQRDDVRNVERVLTDKGNDTVEGSVLADEIVTGEGGDTLVGHDGGDHLVGGPGVDGYSGGSGADVLETADGEADQPISCGEGPVEPNTLDKIIGDLLDFQANPQIIVPGDPSECEIFTFS